MPLADHHDMVKALASYRTNHPLRIGVLPRRARRSNRFSDVEHPGLTPKSFAIDLVAIPDQITRALLQRAPVLTEIRPARLSGVFHK